MAFPLRRTLIIIVSVSFLLFQLYLAFIQPLPPLLQNPIHLILALAVAILWFPLFKPKEGQPENERHRRLGVIIDGVILVTLLFMVGYFFSQADRLMNRIQFLDSLLWLDYFILFATMLILLETVRRTIGWNLLIFILLFIAYLWVGGFLPSIFSHAGTNLNHFTDLMIMGADGIFGAPLNASAGFLYYFILFGTLFAVCGGGNVLINLGMKIGNNSSGGPAKASIASSALLGTVNGSAVANVTSTGVMTIPLMKRAGYKPEEAAAIEASASTSGQILPPIMGVGAFIMADMIGVPYSEIAIAAIIPAAAYLLSLFILVDFISRKNKITQLSKEIVIDTDPILKRLYLLAPMLLVIYNILSGTSLMYAALSGIAAILLINLFRFKSRIRLKELFETFLEGTKQVAQIAIPTAACGIIIGVVIMSGLSSSAGDMIADLGSGGLYLPLLITGIGCILIGLALPTVAAYLASFILFVPVLTELGIAPLPANMFVFYFSIIAQITPPVCLASFAAAGIAKAPAWKTGLLAFRYALVGFLVPFVFVFKPELLLIGTPWQTIQAAIILLIGTVFLVATVSGYMIRPLYGVFERGFMLLCAILVILPDLTTSITGIVLGILAIAYFMKTKDKNRGAGSLVEA